MIIIKHFMTDDKSKAANPEQNADDKNGEQLPVHNPFNSDDDKKITQEDIENEQIYKEAQTERD
jgi:hypothetical protein